MSKRTIAEMKYSPNERGLEILRKDAGVLQSQKPPWLLGVEDVIVPQYVCPANEPTTMEDVEYLKPNDDTYGGEQQARVRALVKPVQFPIQHPIRMELDVNLATYPNEWPKIWVRSASAQDAALTNDGAFHPDMEVLFIDAIEKHGERQRNKIETLLWSFVHRYLVPTNKDPKWPSDMVIPHEIYHRIIHGWQTADKLMEGSDDKELYKSHEDFGSLDAWLDPAVRDWLYTDKSTFPPFAKEISPNVYTFPMFSKEFCDRLATAFVKEKEYAAKHSIPVRRPNNMNTSGAIMSALGMESLMDVLQDRILEPIGQKLFAQTGSEFTDHHSFLVHYEAGHDLGLDMHTDDSDVTYNLCLKQDFTGAKLQVCGIMGEPDHRHGRLAYEHKQGWVICHLGRQRHGADNIDSGVRINLINWNHNKVWRRSAENIASGYSQESGPPDPQCLSYTHDRDWEKYKGKRPFETGRRPWCPPKFAEHKSEVPVHPVGD